MTYKVEPRDRNAKGRAGNYYVVINEHKHIANGFYHKTRESATKHLHNIRVLLR